MNPERWQQVREVMEDAATLDLPERSRYLDSACATDPELRREVESLLCSHDRAGIGSATVRRYQVAVRQYRAISSNAIAALVSTSATMARR